MQSKSLFYNKISNYEQKEMPSDEWIKRKQMEEYSNDLVKQMAKKGLLDKQLKDEDSRFISEKERENKRIADKVRLFNKYFIYNIYLIIIQEALERQNKRDRVKDEFEKGNSELLEQKRKDKEV